jgi:hypothetical protein
MVVYTVLLNYESFRRNYVIIFYFLSKKSYPKTDWSHHNPLIIDDYKKTFKYLIMFYLCLFAQSEGLNK